MMEKSRLKEILERYHLDQCSEEERAWIETWYNEHEDDVVSDLSDVELKQDLRSIYTLLPKPHKTKLMRLWTGVSAAAILLIALFVGFQAYFVKPSDSQAVTQSKVHDEIDIAPGGNNAILTLADGSTISLNDATNGEIAKQQGLKITKTEDGQIIYTVSSEKKQASLTTYNKIATPRGGQYQIVLPDGTKVWLNAASSLTYPTVFTNDKRIVELTGEAYFEVATVKTHRKSGEHINKLVPFIVKTSNQLVKVLGTHFNVNAYQDEPFTKTTLLEGSVKVIPKSDLNSSKKDKGTVLKPGEQSTLKSNKIKVAKINTANAMAWKSGLFQFQNSDIKSVMREFSRWYDVDVEFEGPIPDIQLWGEVHRNVNASQALEILEYFNLKFRIEQTGHIKKIIIS